MTGLGSAGSVIGLIAANGPLFLLLLVWSIVWKGLALWHAARRGSPWWFIFILIINSVGILEILYLFVFCRLKPSQLFSKVSA